MDRVQVASEAKRFEHERSRTKMHVPGKRKSQMVRESEKQGATTRHPSEWKREKKPEEPEKGTGRDNQAMRLAPKTKVERGVHGLVVTNKTHVTLNFWRADELHRRNRSQGCEVDRVQVASEAKRFEHESEPNENACTRKERESHGARKRKSRSHHPPPERVEKKEKTRKRCLEEV